MDVVSVCPLFNVCSSYSYTQHGRRWHILYNNLYLMEERWANGWILGIGSYTAAQPATKRCKRVRVPRRETGRGTEGSSRWGNHMGPDKPQWPTTDYCYWLLIDKEWGEATTDCTFLKGTNPDLSVTIAVPIGFTNSVSTARRLATTLCYFVVSKDVNLIERPVDWILCPFNVKCRYLNTSRHSQWTCLDCTTAL